MKLFWTHLSSLLGVIAIVFSNHAQKWRQICPKVFNPPEFHFSEVTFLQNWYFSNMKDNKKFGARLRKFLQKDWLYHGQSCTYLNMYLDLNARNEKSYFNGI